MTEKRILSILAVVAIGAIVIVIASARYRSAFSSSRTEITQDAELPDDALILRLQPFATGLDRPVGIANTGDYRLFVLEKAGLVKVITRDGSVLSTPYLDIRDRVDSSASEEGLLGLAFHPQYNTNGYFYVNYTNTTDGVRQTRISRFQVSDDPAMADPGSETILLTVEQPYSNHNAGKILFGPDGYLYIPLGDGGSSYDPEENAQNPNLLLGKISRIDVDAAEGSAADCSGDGSGEYTVPVDNPFVDGPGDTCDEIWALGLRNPWQSSFDSQTGDLFLGDVGQHTIEEVDFQPADSLGGENYGWDCYEGTQKLDVSGDPVSCQAPDAYVFPIFEYGRPSGSGNCSVTGGYVYRGQRFPSLHGRYLLTDYCSGRFWDLKRDANGSWQAAEHNDPELLRIGMGNAAFGERCDGELFVANVLRGELFHVTSMENSVTTAQRPNLNSQLTPQSWQFLPIVMASQCH